MRRSRIVRDSKADADRSRPRIVAILLVAGLIVVVGGLAYTALTGRKSPARSSASAFELTVGGTRYEVFEDRPFQIPGRDGKPVEAVLRRTETLTFKKHGVSFRYPASMRVTSRVDEEQATIRVRGLDSPEVTILAYDAPASADVAAASLKSNMAKEMRAVGAEAVDGSEKKIDRRIGPLICAGQVVDYELHHLVLRQELFTFEGENKVCSVVLQYLPKEASQANRNFQVILESFR